MVCGKCPKAKKKRGNMISKIKKKNVRERKRKQKNEGKTESKNC
jgi:hypothetical protein